MSPTERDGNGVRVWSNDTVADDDPDDQSPWERDDWVPDSAVPDAVVFGAGLGTPSGARRDLPAPGAAGEPPPEDFDDPDWPQRSGSLGRKVVAALIVAALLIASAGALLSNGSEPDGAPPSNPLSTLDASAAPGGGSSATTVAPSSTLGTITLDPSSVEVMTGMPADVGGLVVEITELPPAFVAGELPQWAERVIDVPETLRQITSTEVVALSQSDVLSVTEFPSGRSRSIDVSAIGAGPQLAVSDGTILVFSSTDVLQIRDGEPVVVSAVPDGIIFVDGWTGTGRFILTTPATGPRTPEQELVLQPDGSIGLLDGRFADEVVFWSRSFSPDGDVLVTQPGGVYAIAPDGAVNRISEGDLLATGRAHWAIEECDETLRCAYSVVAWDTGEVTPGVLDAIQSFGFIDPATGLSPDGRSIVFRSGDGSGQRKILDVATGSTLDAGRLNQVAHPDAWAADSSGVFITDRFAEFVDRTTGASTAIEDLGRIRSVATGRFAFAD